MLEPIVHLLIQIRMILPKLSQSIGLNLFYTISLPSKFIVKLQCQLGLPLLSSFLLNIYSIFYLIGLLRQQLQYLSFFLHSAVSFRIQVCERLVNSFTDRIKLRVKRFNSIISFLFDHVFKILQPIVSSFNFTMLILSFIIEFSSEFFC